MEEKLWAYFNKELAEGKIDFCIRAHKNNLGGIEFYIRPEGKDGQTLDLSVSEKSPSQIIPEEKK